MTKNAAKKAILYRMVMREHICPYGVKAKHLLEQQGFIVEDNWLTSREQVDVFKAEHKVKTTPQIFINENRIGGMFLNYDLLAKQWVPYSYIYPYAEGLAGILMLAGALNWISIPLALVIGTIGAFSVFKAVYIDKRDLKCACVGGDSNVPLGFISLTENLMMIGMAMMMWLW